MKRLPDDYTGSRHVVRVSQLLQGPGGEDWFEGQVRPGPEPLSPASPNDDILVRLLRGEKAITRMRRLKRSIAPVSEWVICETAH